MGAQTKRANEIPGTSGPACPACSSPTVARRDPTGTTFWGCSQYPACDRATPFEETALSPAQAAANWILEQLDAGRPKKYAVAEAVQSHTSAADAAELFELLSR